MKRTDRYLLALCSAAVLCLGAAGCAGGERQRIFDQAGKDLGQGSYEYALSGFEDSITNQYRLAESWRGAGICNLRMGNLEEAIGDFNNALGMDKVSKALQKDILCYRITAQIESGKLEDALADCRTLAALTPMDADTYFLTGRVALAMDSYAEALSNFEQSYWADSTYDRAIQIYETYVDHDMEADGTYFLELSLESKPGNADDYCDRGRVYYYMDDYDNAKAELINASRGGSKDAVLLLGMVYMGMKDYSNARAMFIQYNSDGGTSAKGYNGLALCDIEEGNYNSAIQNIHDGMPYASTEELQSLLFNEIVVYEKQLDFETARQKAQEYINLFPDDDQVQRELVFLNSRV